DIPAAVARIEAHDGVFFSDHFLLARPLLDAIRRDEPAVLLIDEVDAAGEAPTVRGAHLEQPAWPLSRAETPLPALVPRLPGRGKGAGDRAVQADRAA